MPTLAIDPVVVSRSEGVPQHERFVFRTRSQRYCVAVFCLNEAERIRRQLERMSSLANAVDIVVADGGSTDSSVSPGDLAQLGVRALLVKRDVGRLSAQMRMALSFALEEGYDGVIVIDGNDKDDVTAVPRFVALLESGVDHVQGSRYIPGGHGINTPVLRTLAVRLLHAPLISLAASFHYTDTTNGFRAYSRRFLTDPRVRPFRDVFERYELHYYLAIRAAELGFTIQETPVTRRYPAMGVTPTKIVGMRGNFEILRTLFAACLGRFDP